MIQINLIRRIDKILERGIHFKSQFFDDGRIPSFPGYFDEIFIFCEIVQTAGFSDFQRGTIHGDYSRQDQLDSYPSTVRDQSQMYSRCVSELSRCAGELTGNRIGFLAMTISIRNLRRTYDGF